MSTGGTIMLVAAAIVATRSRRRHRRIHYAKVCCFHGVFSRYDEHCPKCGNPGKPIELVRAKRSREANEPTGTPAP